MTGTSRRLVMWSAVTLFSAIVADSAGQREMSRGEIVMNGACVACHDLRPIHMQAMDAEGWTTMVESMVAKGAEVKKEDIPALVEYLAKEHGPLPNGPGKAIMLDICTRCHDLHRIRDHKATRAEWDDLLVHMINEGAELSDDEFPVLLNYLTRYFKAEE